jgi:hypothetical protein
MAVSGHVGHDKRGSATCARDQRGYEKVAETVEAVTATAQGDGLRHTVQRRVPDDNTPQIAQAFRRWMEGGK